MTIEVNFNIQNWIEMIINIGSVIATVAAVIVALYANKKAHQQLISALKMHEQSKSVDLLDERMNVVDRFERKDYVPPKMIKLLFGADCSIMDTYSRLQNDYKLLAEANAVRRQFFTTVEEIEGSKIKYEIEETILDFERQLSYSDCPQSVEDDYIDYCESHSISYRDEINNEVITLNYYEIKKRIEKYDFEIDCLRTELCSMMEHFIEESIKPLTE